MGFIHRFVDPSERGQSSLFMGIFVGLTAAFGGILYGYDTGTISGVMAMDYVLERFPENKESFTSSESSLIVSILSVGTFFGALLAPLVNDRLGRRWTLILASSIIFNLGVILQTAATEIKMLVAGRCIAGLGVGFISATIPLYQSETAPRWIRGALVSSYQFMITIGLLLAACIIEGTHTRNDSGSYRIPLAIQLLWSLILMTGMFFLPESPRFYVSKGKDEEAKRSLCRLRKLDIDHEEIQEEFQEIKYAYEFELSQGNASWAAVFSTESKQLKKLFTGVCLQAFQQLTGINFIFYFGTAFFTGAGISNPFLTQLATNIVNVGMTIPGILLVEIIGRRKLLLGGAAGMFVAEYIVAIVGTADHGSKAAQQCLVAFTCIFIAFFAASWGPVCWVVVGEIFPLRTRAKSVALSTASNWLWNWAIAYATPYLVGDSSGAYKAGTANLGDKVFFIWGSCNLACFFFVWFFVYETKSLSLEQVDELYDTVDHAWRSSNWQPTGVNTHHFPPDIKNQADHVEAGQV